MFSPPVVAMIDIMITVQDLGKTYGKKTAIAGLNFHVPDGQVTGFLGPNGSGKSTTMRCMLGLDTPTEGRVTFKSKSYNDEFARLSNKPSVAGAILDAGWFTPARSGRSHLRVIARGTGISDARVEECLDYVGMREAAHQKVGGYSLGMKQRIGVAAALLGNPQHLILDEPVNGLDPEGVSWMRNTIRDLASQGRSVLVSSHLLSEMQQTADRLVVIGKGKMIGEYTMSEFLSDGTTVLVESPQAAQLCDALKNRGLAASVQGTQVVIALENADDDPAVRAQVAALALEYGIAVTRLETHQENLEQRFLAATQSVQEYRTSNAGN